MIATEQLSAGARTRSFRRRLAIVAIGIVLAGLGGFTNVFGDYVNFIVAVIAFNAIAVLAVGLLAGLSGIWSLGHSAFVALGAYLTVNLPYYGFPFEAVVVTAAAIAAIMGFVLGLAAGRFSTLYFGLLTLALSLTAVEVIGHWTSATGGDDGIVVPPIWSLLTNSEISIANGTIVAVILATVAYLLADFVAKGSPGRRWLAVKSQRTASQAIGLVPHHENALAFSFSAGLASMSGVAIAVAIGYLDQEGFNLHTSVMMIVATVIGGVGSFAGAVFGAAFVTGVPELARDVPAVSNYVFGVATIVVLLFLRRGVVPSVLGLLRARGKHRASLVGTKERSSNSEIVEMVSELLASSAAGLNIEDLSVSFAGLKALQVVTLGVAPGQTVGLIGPNGAGKTTLLNVLSGYVKPSKVKTLRLGNVDLAGLAPHARIGHGFSRTFQHAELFEELTIRETLTLAAGQATNRAGALANPSFVASRIIHALGLASVADFYPLELPFGIQKVCDIGRVLAAGASTIALDEPFSGLDNNEVGELRAILRGMKEAGVSILIIDHAVHEVMDIADEIVVLDFGKVLARGTPHEIQRNAEVQKAYFGALSGEILAERPNA